LRDPPQRGVETVEIPGKSGKIVVVSTREILSIIKQVETPVVLGPKGAGSTQVQLERWERLKERRKGLGVI